MSNIKTIRIDKEYDSQPVWSTEHKFNKKHNIEFVNEKTENMNFSESLKSGLKIYDDLWEIIHKIKNNSHDRKLNTIEELEDYICKTIPKELAKCAKGENPELTVCYWDDDNLGDTEVK